MKRVPSSVRMGLSGWFATGNRKPSKDILVARETGKQPQAGGASMKVDAMTEVSQGQRLPFGKSIHLFSHQILLVHLLCSWPEAQGWVFCS